MIPVKLTLKNFMCYRDNVPPLSFNGIRLACLSGDNGNGKSALIDAMTWALWGKARTNSDDDLIYTGQSEMEVSFEFAVGKQLYRIIRRRSRPKRRGGVGQSALEFQIETGDGFRPITGNTITQTQEKITGTLHVDYDTFINSAYLRQGHADEFTRQAPAKRKEVLGNILGLDAYDELEEQARGMVRKQEDSKKLLEMNIADFGDEITRKPAYEMELEQAQAALSEIEKTAKEKESRLNGLRRQKEALESKKPQFDELENRIASSASDLQRWEEQSRQHRSRIREYENIINRRAAIEDGYVNLIEAKKINEEFYTRSQRSARLEQQRAQLDRKVADAGHELTRQHDLAQQQINNFEAKVKQLPELKNKLNESQVQLRRMESSEEQVRQCETAVQELQAEVTRLNAEKIRLEREINELAEKLDLISSGSGAKCPLCETELTPEGLARIAANYEADRCRKAELLEQDRAEMTKKQAGLKEKQTEKHQLESRLDQEKTKTRSQAGIITERIAEAEEAAHQMDGLRKTLEGIELRLATRNFAANEQEVLAAVEKELVGLAYDPSAHEEVRKKLGQLEPFDHDKRKLNEALRLIDQEKETASSIEESTRRLRLNLESDRSKRDTLAAELTSLPEMLAVLSLAEEEYRKIAAERGQAQQAVGSISAKIQHCTELEARKKEKEGQLSHASWEEGIYRELAKAFGKGGIQALLIGTALPEIEAEANRLLSRMTDNRMHVKFETQRETKAGNVRETLDINIADELGTRNYEMFSGGEAFRINFAIRIALSRLLARRAGAPLPTLIIDEGFGTQDSTGIEKLKEAINSIREDFEKILVITHLDELKDAFPDRIEVVKTAEGSTILVN